MTDDDMAAAGIGQHGGTDVARVRALFGAVAVLSPQGDPAAGDLLADRNQQMGWRTNQQVAAELVCLAHPGRQITGQGPAWFHQAVHLPITRDELAPHTAVPCR
jgi:hypothetical protein